MNKYFLLFLSFPNEIVCISCGSLLAFKVFNIYQLNNDNFLYDIEVSKPYIIIIIRKAQQLKISFTEFSKRILQHLIKKNLSIN